ncbi:MAG: patatin-like phospholipase family protein [Demequinaceae bacterium]|nr:patatin-like phospholipase family protein [Demequinaceae bacterium]
MAARPEDGVLGLWREAGDGLALALGGGGALGAAHVGVLDVLSEHRIRPRIVVGTSAGAIIGGAYAAGMEPRVMGSLIQRATWSTFGVLTLTPRLGVLDTAALVATIERLGGDRLIEDLPIRFGAVATDVKTRTSVLLDRGRISEALCASIAVPGLFPPARIDGQWLVDGGMMANLPLASAFAMGATHVIGVRLTPEWDSLRVLKTGSEIERLERQDSVTMIRPDFEGFAQWSRRDVPALIQRGREAAKAVIA